jgi:hypothetical protein
MDAGELGFYLFCLTKPRAYERLSASKNLLNTFCRKKAPDSVPFLIKYQGVGAK